ncbi:superinfection immunity protein [Caldichromatium japonicum]|uniref:Superinfection immunity protein n=1 Tax=Caldichromatium japonicum TaxID=2699430 RepID=A0A6G7VES4_9GAMM|nr:superinfection immunity protein [Caldichromatium japonicum]QIK38474.1 superinfection immunity protein [Caldichromatium japonicum]
MRIKTLIYSGLRRLGLWRSLGLLLVLWLSLLLAIDALYPVDVRGWFLSALLILGYLLPLLLAFARQHQRRLLIATLNVLFGWTIIGWFVLLFWALGQADRPTGGTTISY